MGSVVFNVVGPADKVSAIIGRFKQTQGERIVTDVFPSKPNERDVNVRISDDEADDFVDVCEECGVTCEMV